MIGAIYKFLLGDRIYKALMDELDHGSKVIAVFVLLCVTGSPQVEAALGGEVVIDYALRLKRELGRPVVWMAGYSNDVMAYIPSRRVLLEGGYEGESAMIYYGLPTKWSAEVEEHIWLVQQWLQRRQLKATL